MYLMNFSNTTWDLNKFDNQWSRLSNFTKDHDLNGIELLVYGDYFLENLPPGLVQGIHLPYYPCWLEFYQQDTKKLHHLFGSDKAVADYYGSNDPQILVDQYKEAYATARKLESNYMVFHVGHVTEEDLFTLDFSYSDNDVLDASVDLINRAFDEDSSVQLLFENLFWPGLTLLDKDKTLSFMDRIHYENKGIMLDLSHLMISNPYLKTAKDATEYILRKVEALGEARSYIKGIHVNLSLPGEFMIADHRQKAVHLNSLEDPVLRYKHCFQHVKKMDWHVPYDDPSLQEIIDFIEPQFITFETLSSSLEELTSYIEIQNQALNRSFRSSTYIG